MYMFKVAYSIKVTMTYFSELNLRIIF